MRQGVVRDREITTIDVIERRRGCQRLPTFRAVAFLRVAVVAFRVHHITGFLHVVVLSARIDGSGLAVGRCSSCLHGVAVLIDDRVAGGGEPACAEHGVDDELFGGVGIVGHGGNLLYPTPFRVRGWCVSRLFVP